MKKSDLHREWARVLDMCEGTEVNPNICWGYQGNRGDNGVPKFTQDPGSYEFSVAILEGKPVFFGDTIYNKRLGSCHTVTDGTHISDVCWSGYSWNPPKKTFLMNGEELPCPDRSDKYELRIVGFHENIYYFYNNLDIRKVEAAINKLLQDATK